MISRELREKMRNENDQSMAESDGPVTLEDLAREMKYMVALQEQLYAITVNGYSTEDASRGFKMAIEVGRMWDMAKKTWPLLLVGMVSVGVAISILSVEVVDVFKWALDKVI